MTNNDIGPERRHDSIYSNYSAHNSHFNIRIDYHLLSIHVVLNKKSLNLVADRISWKWVN